jgi:hypothetical protein
MHSDATRYAAMQHISLEFALKCTFFNLHFIILNGHPMDSRILPGFFLAGVAKKKCIERTLIRP